MTILEDLKSGRLVVVPREMTAEMVTAHRLARMNTEGGYGGPGPWEAALTASPGHTAGLIALVEGMAATCKQSLQVETIPRAAHAGRYLAETNDGRLLYLNHADEWQECPNFIARALAAEAEVNAQDLLIIAAKRERDAAEAKADALREALANAAEAIEHWGAYASSYLQEKHDWAGDIARARALAALMKEPPHE
jgi:hypothetical protein